MRIGSLFSGYGGLDLAIEVALRRLGIRSRVVWQAEKDRYCRAVLKKHWPRARCYEDVQDVNAYAPPISILGGGFPCQDISIAGERAGLDGARSGLWWEFVRCIRVLRPDVVFVENVPELLVYLGRVLGPLAELGFHAEWDLFDAAAVGAPHRRERLFLLAYTPGFRREGGFGGGDGPRVCRELSDADSLGLHEQQIEVAGRAGAADTRGHGAHRSLADADGCGRARRLADEEGAQARRGAGPEAWAELTRPGRWPAEPDVGRVVDGAGTRLDRRRRRARIRCLGNGVVPEEGELAFLTLAHRAGLVAARPRVQPS